MAAYIREKLRSGTKGAGSPQEDPGLCKASGTCASSTKGGSKDAGSLQITVLTANDFKAEGAACASKV